jgi:very-short-patch-repair endonuclease
MALALSELEEFRWRLPTEHPWEVGRWERLHLVLLAQPIWGPFRADLAITDDRWRHPSPLPVVIEVDGHDFHRSRQQIDYDRARDRFMTGHGAAVLRFTGSEVWRGTARCAEEVLSVAAKRHGARLPRTFDVAADGCVSSDDRPETP